ncbi:LysR family transcriptional regulator [Paraburkholderia lycopersici]|uniref:LysR family transcriptional regulator n=1 Tax=Paraburkholderia lycopersici TaxID=416944 RepID=UPI0015A24A87|nr:LysR family transcriptional regulator [Paraburkholderia lycopersici]
MSVAQAGGFATTATRASLSTAAGSRAIMEPEANLQTRLFNRTTRQISLTDAGRRYLAHCEPILNQVELADAGTMGASAQPAGRLRIHATASFGQHYLTPLLAQYTAQFDDVCVDLVLSQRTPDLLEEKLDVAIVCVQNLKDSSLVSQRVGFTRSVLCASPGYLMRHGTPRALADLEHHTCLQFNLQDMSAAQWLFDDTASESFRTTKAAPLTVNMAEALAQAARTGMVIGLLPVSTALQGIPKTAWFTSSPTGTRYRTIFARSTPRFSIWTRKSKRSSHSCVRRCRRKSPNTSRRSTRRVRGAIVQ